MDPRLSTLLALGALAFSLGWAAPDEGAGTWFPGPPAAIDVARPTPTVDRIRLYLESGDEARALDAATRFAATTKPGRERDAALMVAGVIHREEGRFNLAAEAFRDVRQSGGVLAPTAAFYEADQDLARGHDVTALKRCEQYRKSWPSGRHALDCLRIIAAAEAATGNPAAARAAARTYDDTNETGRISEQIEMLLGMRLARTKPNEAVPLLRELAINHTAPLAGRVAEEELARLAAQGVAGATLPTDPDSRMKRAVSLRDGGRREAAFAEFAELREPKHRNNADVQRFLETENERFGWQTRSWGFLDGDYAERFKKTGDVEWAWKRYKVLSRDGRFAAAADLAVEMQKKYESSPRWRRAEDEIGRTLLLAKRYDEAARQFDAVAARGGYAGRRAQFEAAFATLMAGQAEQAVIRFGALVDADRSVVTESRYWRARALRALERVDAAAQDERWVVENDPWSWYGTLLRDATPERPTQPPYLRSGKWAGAAPISDPGPRLPLQGRSGPLVLSLSPVPFDIPVARPVLAMARPSTQAAPSAFAGWRWGSLELRSGPLGQEFRSGPLGQEIPLSAAEEPRLANGAGLVDTEIDPPSSYRPGTMFDPVAGRRALVRFSEDFADKWPELRVINDLASVGLYDLSGPMLAEWYELWRKQVRAKDKTAKRLSGTSPEAWRQLFMAARDHHNTARQLHGIWETLPASAVDEAYRLGYPLAHDSYVWTHAREHDLDPYLVLGLMRQESTYNSCARSRVGARGAMQIMPKTGHLLADLAHDTAFDAGDLEDPTLAVGYGIRYLGLLMERFDGSYPLAIAAYNGGPFNVSAWLKGPGLDTPMDVFVEHIPYRETRDYVKKVTEGYSAYVALYAPRGALVVVPDRPTADRREVVDF